VEVNQKPMKRIRRTAESHNLKIQELKNLNEKFGSDYFEIKKLSVSASVRNVLYYNRLMKRYLIVDENGRIRFPEMPNYDGMCEVYYDVCRGYNRAAKAKNQIEIPLPTSLHSELIRLRNTFGEKEFYGAVSVMMKDAGYSGELVKKHILRIG
jgi:hypothetical protein